MRELQDYDLVEISNRITDPTMLQNLAAHLKVKPHVVQTKCTDCKSINDAAYHVLKNWFDNQMDKTQAFETMCESLTKIMKSSIIKQVLL